MTSGLAVELLISAFVLVVIGYVYAIVATAVYEVSLTSIEDRCPDCILWREVGTDDTNPPRCVEKHDRTASGISSLWVFTLPAIGMWLLIKELRLGPFAIGERLAESFLTWRREKNEILLWDEDEWRSDVEEDPGTQPGSTA